MFSFIRVALITVSLHSNRTVTMTKTHNKKLTMTNKVKHTVIRFMSVFLVMVAHTWNPTTGKLEEGDTGVQVQPQSLYSKFKDNLSCGRLSTNVSRFIPHCLPYSRLLINQ